jgi:hypothetical protein
MVGSMPPDDISRPGAVFIDQIEVVFVAPLLRSSTCSGRPERVEGRVNPLSGISVAAPPPTPG